MTARHPSPGPKHAPPLRMPFALLVAGLVVGGMCTLLALNTASAANEVRRHDLAARDQGVAAQIVQLANEAQDSSAPANLAAAAAALGMVPAGDPAFLEFGPDGRVRLLGSPGPASAAPVSVPRPTPTASKAKPTTTVGTKTAAKRETTGTRTKTTGARATGTKKPTHAPTGAASTRTSHSATTPTPTPTPTRTPTPTPTPGSTLPGGTR